MLKKCNRSCLSFSRSTILCYFSDFIVSCDNVTGSVGNEGTFTCRVSLQRTDCCIQIYKFQYPNRYNDSAICKEEFPVNSCEQRNSFTCPYTPSTAMTEQFRIFLQTTCGVNITEFTVNIPGTVYNIFVYHSVNLCTFVFNLCDLKCLSANYT